jgi:hypothetical protein
MISIVAGILKKNDILVCKKRSSFLALAYINVVAFAAMFLFSIPAQGAISLVATGTTASSTGSNNRDLVVPTIVDNDLLVAHVAIRGNRTITTPAGWTLVDQVYVSNGRITQGIYYKVGLTSDSNTTVGWTFSASDDNAGVIRAYRGVNAVVPIIGNFSGATGNSNTMTATSIATTVADEWLLAFYGAADGRSSPASTPVGMTERYDFDNGGDGNGLSLAGDDEARPTAGATGNRVSTSSQSDWYVAQLVALKPIAFPTVVSINRASPNPTTAASVSWTVIFSAGVSGVDVTDFALAVTGVTGASITTVAGSGTTWTVSANTGSGSGTLGLNLVDNDSIVDGTSRPLGGAGAGNGNFSGEIYDVRVVGGGVINTYYPGATASVAVGASSIVLGAASGATTPIAIGDTLLIMQMQDAGIDSTNTATYGDGVAGDPGSGTTGVGNSGLYEYAIADGTVPLGGGTLTLACGTTNTYTNAAATVSAGQKKYQVIRVPVYASGTLTSALAASAWDGSRGGVLAFDVTGALTLGSATVGVNGMGFRGGGVFTSTTGSGTNTDYRTPVTNGANGGKGEGIAGTPYYVFTAPGTLTTTGAEGYPNGSRGRGAPGNAGGGATDRHPGPPPTATSYNDENPGGGGGANGGTGGMGGIGWCPAFTNTAPYYGCGYAALATATNPGGSTGGFGGVAVPGLGATRLTLGGGGGAGTANNITGSGACTAVNGLCTSGAAGGGVIMIRAGSMTGSATFNARGSNGDSTVGNDGSGGGGAGGAVLISSPTGMGGVTINVNGGKGGDNLVSTNSTPHGPGGGGGGGYALTSASASACNNGGGANGVTYNNGTLFGAYGSTSGSSGSCTTGLTAAQIPGTILGASSCGASVDHYELSLPTVSITCLPTPVTVTACADISSPCTNPATTVTGETATLATSAGTLAATTVTFNASGVAGTTLSYPDAVNGATASVTLSNESTTASNQRTCCPPDGINCEAASSCSTTFNTAGFIFSPSTGGGVATIPPQVAGVSSGTYYLRAVQTNTITKVCEAALVESNSVDFAYECNDPATCYADNLMSVNGGSATTIARNNNGSVASYTSVSMTFDANGNASFTFIYNDAGKVTLHARMDSALLTGSSNAFVVKPYDFGVIPCAASVVGDCTAAPADPGLAGIGGVFAQAGELFKTTVTARTASGTPTFSFGLGSYNATEMVTLTHTRVAPTGVGAADGALGGTLSMFRSSFSNGIATVNDLSWSEVGVITLTATNSAFLGNALTTTGTTGNLGRFIPDHFEVSLLPDPPGFADNCAGGASAFTYLGQPFNWAAIPVLTIRAVNSVNAITQNYEGDFWKLADPLASYTYVDANVPAAASPLTPADSSQALPDTNTCNGVVTISLVEANFNYTRPVMTTPVTPFVPNVSLSIPQAGLTDTDNVCYDLGAGVGCQGFVVTEITGTHMRHGQIRIFNNFGPETASITNSPFEVHYYDGTTWVVNTDDTCTTGLTFCPPARISAIQPDPLTSGKGTFSVSTSAVAGTLTVCPTAPVWLTALTDCTAPDSSCGEFTFGIYRGNDRIINWQEIMQ